MTMYRETVSPPVLPSRGVARAMQVLTAGLLAVAIVLQSLSLMPQSAPTRPVASGNISSGTTPNVDLKEGYGAIPLAFEPNQGQTDPQVRYIARGAGYSLFLTSSEAVLSLARPAGEGEAAESAVVRMSLVGANPPSEITGLDQQPGKLNYITGNDSTRWRTGIPTYSKVHYSQVYPGIDAVYYGNGRQLEYDFVVSPGANPKSIALNFGGVDRLELDPEGDLLLHTGTGTVRQHKPFTFQMIDGVKQEIPSRYVLDGKRVSFELGKYDSNRELVIDPRVEYSTFLGGGDVDVVRAVTVDGFGNAYITGKAGSTDFPTTRAKTGYGTPGYAFDVFVTKLNAAGNALVYSTYIGTDSVEEAYSIAVDDVGRAYVTGRALAPDYPRTAGAIQAASEYSEAFVTVLNGTGGLFYSGKFDAPRGYGIEAYKDTAGNYYAYIVGQADYGFTGTPNAFDPVCGLNDDEFCSGGPDGFFMKLKVGPTGASSPVYSTLIGGGSSPDYLTEDAAHAVAVDSAGNAYITGSTRTTDFPTKNPIAGGSSFKGGSSDAFVMKVNPAASGADSLVYSSYLGGSGDDIGWGVDVAQHTDGTSSAYVAGETRSSTFPTTASAYQPTYVGGADKWGDPGGDAFVTKVSSAGNALSYSTFLGRSGNDRAVDIAVDASGVAYVAGVTSSEDFPLVDPTVKFHFYLDDIFVAKLDPAIAGAGGLKYSSYFGSTGNDDYIFDLDRSTAIDVDGAGNIYLGGYANFGNFPFSYGSYDSVCGPNNSTAPCGGSDGFVMKISPLAPTDKCTTATGLTGEAVSDQVIVKFRSNVKSAERQSALRELGLSKVDDLGFIGAQVVKTNGRSARDVALQLSRRPDVEYASPDYIRKAAAYSDETKFTQLWGLHNTGQAIQVFDNFGTPDIDIDMLEASAVTLGSSSPVAVIDTGVDFSHPDLAGQQWVNPGESGTKATNGLDDDGNGYIDDVNGWDFYNNDQTVFDAAQADEHGTHIAGTIAAKMDGQGMVGIAPRAKIMSLKFLGPDGGSDSNAIKAIEYAINKGVRISNNSYGGSGCNPALKDAIAKASSMLFVAAAGNGGSDGSADNNDIALFYPASYDVPTIISVAAVDKDGNFADFSNWGSRTVDIAAPGDEIYSTVPGGKYDWYPGTSMAAPHVAGVAALLRAIQPTVAPADMKQIMMSKGTALPDTSDTGGGSDATAREKGLKTVSGKMLNADNAVRYLRSLDTIAPTVSLSAPAEGAWVRGTVTLSATASDNFGVDRVEFLVNGVKVGTDYIAPYSIPWSSAGITTGSHTITARAWDTTGHSTLSSGRTVNVDNTRPSGTVSINNGAASTNSPTVSVKAPATDTGSGLSQLRLSNSSVTSGGLLSKAKVITYTTTAISWSLTDATYGGTTTQGTKTVYVQWKDMVGNWSAVKSDAIVLDTVPPVASAPVSKLIAGTQLGTSTIPVTVSWAAATDTGSGVARYELQQKSGTGSWTSVTLPTPLTRTVNRSLAPGTYQYQVRAQDKAGNWSTWKQGQSFTLKAYQQTSTASDGKVAYAGTWSNHSLTSYYGGSVRYSTTAKATASFAFTTGKQVAWVAAKGSNRGYAHMYLDGTKVATINLYSSTVKYRQVVWTKAWAMAGTHTLKVYVTGTKPTGSTGTRVDVDGFVVLR